MRRLLGRVGFLIATILVVWQPLTFAASDNTQQQAYQLHINLYDVVGGSDIGDCSTTTTLTGSDAQEQTWNYFKNKGLSDVQIAAVIGNLMVESSLVPTRVEANTKHPELPSNSKDPVNLPVVDGWYGGQVRQPGWGLAQWTPSKKIVDIAQQAGVDTSSVSTLAAQLDIVWWELGNTTPTGVKNYINSFQKETDLSTATLDFSKNFEGPAVLGARLTYAQSAMDKYSGSGGDSSASSATSTGCGSVASTLSPDCQSASGNAKILCAAKKYDPVSYAENGIAQRSAKTWHDQCPTVGPSCATDCSGLVDLAVYDAFGVDLHENTGGERADIGKYWKKISFNQLQAGDIVQPNSGHVIIVDHIVGRKIADFAANNGSEPQPDQVSAQTYYGESSGSLYLRYIGPGSS